MAFPISPTNGQTATINGINYAYSTTNNAWKRVVGGTGAGTITYNPIQVATAGQTVFPVPSGYAGNLIMVYVNGYKLPPSDYSAVNGSSITLAVGSNLNDEIETVVFSAQVMGATSTLQRTSVIATAAQTTFSVTYPVGMILVKVNGLIVPTSDYTAIDGVSVTLASGVPVGTEIEFLVFSAMNLVNAVPSTGGTMTGALSVNADVSMTSQNSGPIAGFRNLIINGDMRIDQRNNGAVYAGAGYSVDRFGMSVSGPIVQQQQVVDGPNAQFYRSLKVQVTTASSAVVETVSRQMIELANVRNAAGSRLNLSFWYKSSKVGSHGVRFFPGAGTTGGQDYGATFTVSTANTWAFYSFTFDSILNVTSWGTTADTAVGVYLDIGFRSGGTGGGGFTTLAVGDSYNITGVQLERGSVATPFEQRPYGLELSLCQRYYWQANSLTLSTGVYRTASTLENCLFQLPVPMRISPTVTALALSGIILVNGTSTPITGLNTAVANQNLGVSLNINSAAQPINAAAYVSLSSTITASAEL